MTSHTRKFSLLPKKSFWFFFLIASVSLQGFRSYAQCNLPRANLKYIDTASLRPCEGDSLVLEAAYRPPSLGIQWYRDGQAIAGQTGPTYSVKTSGSFYFLYRQGDTCQSACYDEVPVNFRPFPSVPKPLISLKTKPDTSAGGCYRNFVIRSTGGEGFSRSWLNDGRVIPGQTDSLLASDTLGIYRLKLVSPQGCMALSDPIRVDVDGSLKKFRPLIQLATVVDTLGAERCMVFWSIKTPLNPMIRRVRIFREETPGVFRLVGSVAPADTAFLDLSSEPGKKPYYYRIQALLQCGSDSFVTAPSPWHRCIHLTLAQHSNAPVFHLGWTPYEGMQVNGWEILAIDGNGEQIDSIISLPPQVTSYTYVSSGIIPTAFQIRAVSDNVIPSWGRVMASSRKSLSNTRPTILRLACSQSAFNEGLLVSRAVSGIQRPEMELFPSPSSDASCTLISSGDIESVWLFDATGRQHALQTEQISPERLQLRADAGLPDGLYFLKIKDSGGRIRTMPWLLQR